MLQLSFFAVKIVTEGAQMFISGSRPVKECAMCRIYRTLGDASGAAFHQ